MFVGEYEAKEPNGLHNRRWEGSYKMGKNK